MWVCLNCCSLQICWRRVIRLKKIAYLTDILEHLNELNWKSQRPCKYYTYSQSLWIWSKVQLWKKDKNDIFVIFSWCYILNRKENYWLLEQYLSMHEVEFYHYFKIPMIKIWKTFAFPQEISTLYLSIKEGPGNLINVFLMVHDKK